MNNSPDLGAPMRTIGEALRDRGVADRRRGLALEQCPFRTLKMQEGWRKGWLTADIPNLPV